MSFEKYLKYKNKYTELKYFQLGGMLANKSVYNELYNIYIEIRDFERLNIKPSSNIYDTIEYIEQENFTDNIFNIVSSLNNGIKQINEPNMRFEEMIEMLRSFKMIFFKLLLYTNFEKLLTLLDNNYIYLQTQFKDTPGSIVAIFKDSLVKLRNNDKIIKDLIDKNRQEENITEYIRNTEKIVELYNIISLVISLLHKCLVIYTNYMINKNIDNLNVIGNNLFNQNISNPDDKIKIIYLAMTQYCKKINSKLTNKLVELGKNFPV